MIEFILFSLKGIFLLFLLYVVIRIASVALFRSYFELKKQLEKEEDNES